jgi:hypothetical protein
MTTTAAAPACPRCGNGMWDQKNGKFPWKVGTPIFKCKTKECASAGGVIWEPKNGTPPAQAAPPKSAPFSRASRPEAELPEFLRDADAQDKAELAAKIGEVPAGLDKKASIAWAQKQSLAIVLEVYEPMFVAKNIGMTDDTVHKLSFELFKTWSDKGLVG